MSTMLSTAPAAVAARAAIMERLRFQAPAALEAEQQWIFSDEELRQTPSIVDGMSQDEELQIRRKSINFIIQIGIMLKLPQTTMATAAVFFHRTLMRMSLVSAKSRKALHHYQIAATALFLATKVEENCRKMKELIVACVRVALKDPNKIVDEQTKEYWKWRDTILYNEDVLLEALCFDVSIESPYKTMYDLLKYYGLEHNKKLRDDCWAFLSDFCLTPLCLSFTSRTVALASVYCGAHHTAVALPDEDGKPWWEVQGVGLHDIRRVCSDMAAIFELQPSKEADPNIYVGLRELDNIDPLNDKTRLKGGQTPMSATDSPVGKERSPSPQSAKRKREEAEKQSSDTKKPRTGNMNGNMRNEKLESEQDAKPSSGPNGSAAGHGTDPPRQHIDKDEPASPKPDTIAPEAPEVSEAAAQEDEEVSEEGEVEE